MSLKIKIGKETIQGYTRVISHADMTECYAYAISSLIALEFLKINKSSRTGGVIMGYSIAALRQIMFAKVKRDPKRNERLPLGTLFWGKHCSIDKEVLGHKDFQIALGDLRELIAIWGEHIDIDE